MNDKWEFDEFYWGKIILRPDWYLELVPYIQKVQKTLGEESEDFKKLTKNLRYFFEQALENNLVALAEDGPNLDAERQPINTIVIHHTSAIPGYKLSYMNAVQLLNIYAPYFYNPTDEREKSLKGQAIWSNHSRDGKPSFLAYHWLVRMDGTFERLLEDEQLGWHAGNWEINKRSVAICLDNDYEHQDPNNEILQKLASHINEHYDFVNVDNIIGHQEARSGTVCPGAHFLKGWKPKLLGYVENAK